MQGGARRILVIFEGDRRSLADQNGAQWISTEHGKTWQSLIELDEVLRIMTEITAARWSLAKYDVSQWSSMELTEACWSFLEHV